MAAFSGIKLEGVAGFALKLGSFFNRIDQRVTDAVNLTALLIESEAKRLVPVDTGRLRSSITTERVGKLELRVLSNVEYAKFVEYGTRRMPARPFLFLAAESQRVAYQQRLKAILKL